MLLEEGSQKDLECPEAVKSLLKRQWQQQGLHAIPERVWAKKPSLVDTLWVPKSIANHPQVSHHTNTEQHIAKRRPTHSTLPTLPSTLTATSRALDCWLGNPPLGT